MKHTIRLTRQKIGRFQKIVEPLVYQQQERLAPFRYKAMAALDAQLLDPTFDDTEWQMLPHRSYWGGANVNFVMRGIFTVPASFSAGAPIALRLLLGDAEQFSHPEALVYIDGEPFAAVDRHHHEVLLKPEHCNGRSHHLLLWGWTGTIGYERGKQLFLRQCSIVQIHQPTRDFLTGSRTALETAELLEATNPAQMRLLNALDAAYQQLDLREPFGDAFYASVPEALACLQEGIARAGTPLDADLIAAGHAHIDVAWLWPLAETRRKAGRTFHNVLRLMEQFPNYHFTQSQPQLYDFIRQDYPALFEAIKQRVVDGRWEPIGGMWVEADCIITGPESLARQFLLGRTFFREHFGEDAESPLLWLPDVFGYAWSLPQLIKQADLDYFFTIKIGWNQVNKMPYDSFWWQGIDGTKVLTHFSTTPETPWRSEKPLPPDLFKSATYNAQLRAFTALGSWAKLLHKETQNVMLMSYGYGDGGGGPTREMNENAEWLHEFPALPQVQQGKVIDFFRRLEAESGAELPTWNSELYLELHRGTYTSQSRNKRAHRKSEFLLHDAEYLATLAALLDAAYEYPHETLQQAWQLQCLQQFHDIIPGSSIHQVYVESAEQYAQIREMGTAVSQTALTTIQQHTGGNLLLINPTGFARNDLAFWPGALPAGQQLANVYTQAVDGGTLIGGVEMEAYAVRPFAFTSDQPRQPDSTQFPLHITPSLLENAFLRVELNEAGDICHIFDKTHQCELLPPGAVANQFQAFSDRPLNWDAWDIDIYYDDKLYLAEPAGRIEVVEAGPLRATLAIERRILNSSYTQHISLTYNSPLLRFDTTIQWQERHILLKTAFPIEVLSPVATYEIQWGSVQRPTHRNSSWDWARFETAAQKWVDLSEGGYGVALINDCKYGHDIHNNIMRLSLLRAPTNPDPEADQGEHRFAYGLYPHTNEGSVVNPSDIAQVAYAFNDPLLVVAGNGGVERPYPPFIQTPVSFIVETIKQAEDGQGIIVRGYECNRQRGWLTFKTGFTLAEAHLCNLLEENRETIPVSGSEIKLYVKPFQIVTLRLLPNHLFV
ncbi:MAG: alpha-mannosidase [Anaerolineaceae bacterium]|nr:alpha-mannosidase [Anaerolineaceae bacterium]